jgi:predicted glycosyltransferase
MVALYRPRAVLVDHMPQGKHRELRPALETARDFETRWVLGLRGVVGGVEQVWSDLAMQLFRAHYQGLLWYGDSKVLGSAHVNGLRARFGIAPVETGYVSRLKELTHQDPVKHLDFCRIEPAGSRYVRALLDSKVSIIYGGYNSLTDVLCAGKPSLVILRDMKDNEQTAHAAALGQHLGDGMAFLEEKGVDAQVLGEALGRLISGKTGMAGSIKLTGAEKAARVLADLIETG